MGLSSIVVEQREKEEQTLSSFLAFSLISSVALHIALLSLSSLGVRTPKLAEDPIEVVVMEQPSLEAAEPKQKTPSKAESVSKPERVSKAESVSKGGSVARGGSDGGSKAGGTADTPLALSSQPIAKRPKLVLSAPPMIAKKQPKLVDAPITPRVNTLPPSVSKLPKQKEMPTVPTLPPLPIQTFQPQLKPIPTLPPQLVATPKPALINREETAVKLKPVITPSPSPAQTKPIPQPRDRVNPFPQQENSNAPTQPLRAPEQSSEKVRKLLRERTNSQQSQEIARNNLRQSDKTSGGSDRSKVTANLQNGEARGSGLGSGTRDSRQATDTGTSNGLGNGSGRGIGTGNGNGAGNSSGRIACRRCPDPNYPSRAKRDGLSGTVKVVFDADPKGNVSNIRLASSSGHDILDQQAIETVKKWQLESSDKERREILQSFTFALQGSDLERLAHERRDRQQSQARKREQPEQRVPKPSNLQPLASPSIPEEPSPPPAPAK